MPLDDNGEGEPTKTPTPEGANGNKGKETTVVTSGEGKRSGKRRKGRIADERDDAGDDDSDEDVRAGRASVLALPEEQQLWFARFHELFEAADADEHLELLADCGCFSETDWRENFRHAACRAVHTDSSPYASAEERVIECLQQGDRRLVLADSLLTRLPSLVGALHRNLTTLALTELDVRSLPRDVSRLTALRELSVTKCPLERLPAWIGALTALHRLDLTRCKLATLPSELSLCSDLQHLGLAYNDLTALPDAVLTGLPRLRSATIDANPLRLAWRSSDWPSLQRLSASETDASGPDALPSHLCSRLEALVMSNCGLQTLPSSLGTRLQHLDLGRNRLRSVPESIGDLIALRHLALQQNELTTLPPSMTRLAALVDLKLDGNPLAPGWQLSLPDSPRTRVYGSLKPVVAAADA